MDEIKRVTVYFVADVHRALRLRAAAWKRSISDMVREAVRTTLAEDPDDLRDVDQWQDQSSASFEEFVVDLGRVPLRDSSQLWPLA
jgi:hypothetical protein